MQDTTVLYIGLVGSLMVWLAMLVASAYQYAKHVRQHLRERRALRSAVTPMVMGFFFIFVAMVFGMIIVMENMKAKCKK